MSTAKSQPVMAIEEMNQSAWIGEPFRSGETTAVIVNFHGLGGGGKNGPGYEEQEWGSNGGLVVYPYYGPWSWMNRSARAFVDRLITSVYHHQKLDETVPLIIAGGSMGGQASLIYTRYSPHKIAACFANFPVCDLEYHFTERPDLPATMRYAYRDYPGTFTDALIEHSPLKQASSMPAIPYLLIHGDKDLAVNKEKHSDRFVAEMRKASRDIEYLEIPGMGHNTNTPFRASRAQIDFVKRFFKKK
jgi:dipeptidyl aminopeptidase/acylaminoacyl peptidase